MTGVRAGAIGPSLKSYLSPLPSAKLIDLDTTAGLQTVVETVRPRRLNRGRWFTNAGQSMALMQQFAISSSLDMATGQTTPLFSVNGPPGTGKTTLLQDVVADLVVSRARVFAELDKPQEAFLPQRRPVQVPGRIIRLSVLKPALTDF